jgi:biotin carboxylase
MGMEESSPPKRVMLLMTSHTYRAQPFLAAAEQLGIEIVKAVDMPEQLADYWQMRLGIDFNKPETAVNSITDYARERPLAAIIAIDDNGALIAAKASGALGLPHNDPGAAEAARNKAVMRQALAEAGVASPRFRQFTSDEPMSIVSACVTADIGYPCVVKPLTLNGSRGVIRANDAPQLATVVARVKRLLNTIHAPPHSFLVEQFIPGFEVALEGVLDDGRLHVLALFDKPDPLDGPFFEETIYVTPSQLPEDVQSAIADTTMQAATALGLQMGPVHAELRINENGPWIVEVAGRSIGGLCSQSLRFDVGMGQEAMSLEALILRQACGLDVSQHRREQRASGVMMIPIPSAGILRDYAGLEAAESVPGIDEVTITAKRNYRLLPLPEGESYLGFIFASGETPAEVEAALRAAHSCLQFEIDEEIPLLVNDNVFPPP